MSRRCNRIWVASIKSGNCRPANRATLVAIGAAETGLPQAEAEKRIDAA
jgi:hypothetical protein